MIFQSSTVVIFYILDGHGGRADDIANSVNPATRFIILIVVMSTKAPLSPSTFRRNNFPAAPA